MAIDWAFIGVSPIGAELAPLVVASVALQEVDHGDAGRLERLALDGYLAGLHEVGWHGDPLDVQVGYSMSAALRYPLGCLRLVLPALLEDDKRPGSNAWPA